MATTFRKVREAAATVVLVVRESARSFDRNGGFERSATLAYYCFLALIPLLLLEVLLLSHFIQSSAAALHAIEEVTAQILPMSDQIILDEVVALTHRKGWGVVATVILFWSVMPLVSSIRRAFHEIFKYEDQAAFLTAKGRDVLAVLIIMALLVALVIARLAYATVVGGLPVRISFLLHAAHLVLPLAVAIASLVLLYRVFVPVKLKWRHLLGGSVLTTILWSVMGPVFTLILRYNPDYGVTFGSLKAVFLLFVWAYYSFAIVLLGTEIMANMARLDALLVRDLLVQSGGRHAHGLLLGKLTRAHDQGEVIFREGDPGTQMYYILRGAVSLSRNGQPFVVMNAGQYFGEMAILIESPRTMTATVAAPDTDLVPISRDNLDVVLRENPRVVLRILRDMATRLKDTDEHIQGRQA